MPGGGFGPHVGDCNLPTAETDAGETRLGLYECHIRTWLITQYAHNDDLGAVWAKESKQGLTGIIYVKCFS